MNGARWNPISHDAQVQYLLPGSPKLAFLELNSGRKFRAAHLAWFLPFAPSLTHLDLRGNRKLDDSDVTSFVSRFTELKYLRLARCFALTDASLGTGLAEKLTKIESLDLSDTKASDHSIAQWLKCCPKLRSLSFARSGASEQCLPIIGRLGQHLLYLNMDSHSRFCDPMVEHLRSLSNLRTLNLGGCYALTGRCVVSTISNLPSLQNLTLSRCTIDDYEFSHLSKLTNLETLTVASCTDLDGTGLEFVSTSLSRLKSLNLSSCDLLPEKLAHLTPTSPTLVELNLSSCNLSDQSMPFIGELTNLTSLDISRSLLSDSGMQYLTALSKLQTLSLSQSAELSDRGLLSLTHLTSLTQLDVSWNDEITVISLSEIIKLPLLKRIDLSYCQSVPGDFVEHVHLESGIDIYIPLTET